MCSKFKKTLFDALFQKAISSSSLSSINNDEVKEKKEKIVEAVIERKDKQEELVGRTNDCQVEVETEEIITSNTDVAVYTGDQVYKTSELYFIKGILPPLSFTSIVNANFFNANLL